LGLIDHEQSAAGLFDEERGIGLRDRQGGRVIERDLAYVQRTCGHQLGEGALAHLAGTLDDHHRCVREGIAYRCLQGPRVGFVAVHDHSLSRSLQN